MFGRHQKSEFRYKPRFYDENTEELKERVRAIKREMGEYDDKSKPGRTIRGAFTTDRVAKKKSEEQKRLFNSNIRLIFIIILLLFVAWKILSTDSIAHIFHQFKNMSNGR